MENESKCGEIFRYGPGKYIFSCTFCEKQFMSHSTALSHIESHFLVHHIDASKVNKSEIELPPNKVEAIETPNPVVPDKEEYDLDIKEETPPYTQFDPFMDPPASGCSSTTQENNSTDSNVNIRDQLMHHTPPSKKIGPKPMAWGLPILSKSIIECDICGIRTQRKCADEHLRKHTNKDPHKCTICSREYGTLKSLKIHTTTHSLVKKYSCHICGWQFHSGSNLKVHIRIHNGEKRYKCTICEKSFVTSNGLILHQRLHTGEKPFKCTLCDESFTSHSSRKLHVRKHTNDKQYKCTHCDRLFFTSVSLTIHERTHTGERPFECGVCAQKFSSRGGLRQHAILHTGTKPHRCRVCDLTFAQIAGRRSHERSVHKDVAHLVAEPSKPVAVVAARQRGKKKTRVASRDPS